MQYNKREDGQTNKIKLYPMHVQLASGLVITLDREIIEYFTIYVE